MPARKMIEMNEERIEAFGRAFDNSLPVVEKVFKNVENVVVKLTSATEDDIPQATVEYIAFQVLLTLNQEYLDCSYIVT